MPRLTVTDPASGDPREEISMATALEGLARKLIAARPVTVLVSYEVPGVPGLQVVSLPDSPVVRSGHVDALVEQVFPARVRPALD